MQLDNTRITIRERTLGENLDLALHVIWEFFQPWLATTLLAVVPLAVINYALIGWMADLDYGEGNAAWLLENTYLFRYLWNMTLLIYLEAPLVGNFSTAYLGPAVFMERKTIRQVVLDTLKRAHQLILNVLVLRGVLPAWLLMLALNQWYRLETNYFIEAFLMPVLVCYAALFRMMRPFTSEIILLERLPLRSPNPAEMTLGKRSASLQGPHSGDLMVRFILGSLVGMLLWFALVFSTLIVLKFLFDTGDLTMIDMLLRFDLSWYHTQLAYPLLLWLIVAYYAAARFLDYLDLRIRHEGWEVELLMRAEALRLAGKPW